MLGATLLPVRHFVPIFYPRVGIIDSQQVSATEILARLPLPAFYFF
jgi:hypothetical protein